jgi:hypothetical protein
MSKNTLEAIRAKLKEAKTRGGSGSRSNGGDNASYAFWNIPDNQTATVRFLPDKDPENTFFWRRREVIKLPFEGAVGGQYPTTQRVIVNVPCVEMWGEQCPILREVRIWWKDPAKEELARAYWKKKSYIYQGFVGTSPFEEEEKPENPIRRFLINPSIHDIIEKSLMDAEMEDAPTDYVGGRDFVIRKSRKDKYANYGTSSWSFKTRTLSADEMGAIDNHGLFDLKEFLGRKPDADEMDAIKALFEASKAGDPFDSDSFGKWYRAFGGRNEDGESRVSATPQQTTQVGFRQQASAGGGGTGAPARQATASVQTRVEPAHDEDGVILEEAPAPVPRQAAPAAQPVADESVGGKADPQAILARIRARTGAGR